MEFEAALFKARPLTGGDSNEAALLTVEPRDGTALTFWC